MNIHVNNLKKSVYGEEEIVKLEGIVKQKSILPSRKPQDDEDLEVEVSSWTYFLENFMTQGEGESKWWW